jgi:hypothetical protein
VRKFEIPASVTKLTTGSKLYPFTKRVKERSIERKREKEFLASMW